MCLCIKLTVILLLWYTLLTNKLHLGAATQYSLLFSLIRVGIYKSLGLQL